MASRKPARRKASTAATPTPDTQKKPINLALQGGGAHGAFAWGVIDKFMEDGRLEIEGVSGTSAGSMNAVALAHGALDGNAACRQSLEDFWHAVSRAGNRYNPLGQLGAFNALTGNTLFQSMASQWFRAITHTFSPYQLNPLNINPLRDLLVQTIDFERLQRESRIKLFLAATNVRTGKVKVFGIDEAISADMVMASACLPQLFRAVEIDGEHYWDGGFMGNPVLYPLFYHTVSPDVLIVHINPIERAGPPMQAEDILNRVNEITFNSSLIKELRAVHFVQKLMDEGWIKEEHRGKLKYVLMHSIRSDLVLADLSAHSKFRSDWG
ncbi:MAG: patatin-like phospholipase family protein, partial [Rhodoferax sp.]